MGAQKTLVGTELKMVVNFLYPSDSDITLDTIDFYVEFFCKPRQRLVLQKEDLVREEEEIEGLTVVTWYAMVDTNIVGPGQLKMRLMAYIPDAAASEEIREEYAEIDTNVIIDKA